MKLQDQVTSVVLSNKLRRLFDEIKVQKPSIFFRDWTGAKEEEIEMWKDDLPDWCEDNIPCYTVAELGEMLPCFVEKDNRVYWVEISKEWNTTQGNAWVIALVSRDNDLGHTLEYMEEKTEADARAKMLIYLLENKLTTLPN